MHGKGRVSLYQISKIIVLQNTLYLHVYDKLCKVHYRLVTVLPALNNIFERLLAGQMYEFYREILSDFISAYRKFHSCETSLLRLTED